MQKTNTILVFLFFRLYIQLLIVAIDAIVGVFLTTITSEVLSNARPRLDCLVVLEDAFVLAGLPCSRNSFAKEVGSAIERLRSVCC